MKSHSSPTKYLILLFLVFLTARVAAQRFPSAANGKVYGKVLDASTGKPAEFATVSIFSSRTDSVLGGSMVRANGDFAIGGLPMGPLRVKISFIGYVPIERTVTLTPDRAELDLGDLELRTDVELLQEAQVVGEKSTMTMQVDRRVFNVEKDLSTQGGNGVDVMKNVPGLSVDVDGNVEMRGSRPQILVDGRPSAMTLDQIPAEEIERVEVITNPSVAFDASTTGGIINVVLKKNTRPGYGGQAQVGIGSNDRYQAGFNAFAKEGRWGFNLSYNYSTGRNTTNGDTRRTDLNNGETIGTFEQTTTSNSTRGGHGGRLGVDWQVSNRSALSLSQNIRFREMDGRDVQEFGSRSATGSLLGHGEQVNTNDNRMNSYSTQLAYRHSAPKEGKEWTMDLNYNRWNRDSRSRFGQYTYDEEDIALPDSPRLQDNIGGSGYDQYTFQADFKDPITDRTKLEWGVKSNLRYDNTYLDVFVTSPLVGDAVLDTALTNDYRITDMINAAYFNWSQMLSPRWSMQAGLRFEQTWFETELRGKDQVFSYKYPDGTENLGKALFPALYIVRKWENSTRELQVNFSRKIDRPRFWQIMPFIMYSDSRNVRIGNPTIAPELSNLAEVNHLLPILKGKGSWLTSVYGRYTQDVITNYATPLASDTTILLNTFVNGSHSVNGGWENIFKYEPVKGLQLTLSGTLQYTDVSLGSAQGGARNQGTNWEAKALINYRYKGNWTFQLNGEYDSPRVQAQGRSLEQYGVDVSVGRDFSKRLTGVVSVNDVFYTRRWGNTIDTPYLVQESFRRREQRFVRFTLTWKFGERDVSIFRKKGQARPDAGNSGGDMDF
ncbi:MAG: outer membrane beta-barrel protein [Flavobacteriales bacterium]|nr:outer membrane beta-barrel protein [Flavobacteriales bacterium]